MDDDFYKTRIQFLRELRELLIRFNAEISIDDISEPSDLDIIVNNEWVNVISPPIRELTPDSINEIVSALYEKTKQEST